MVVDGSISKIFGVVETTLLFNFKYCMNYSSENSNLMVGKNGSLLKRINDVRKGQGIFDAGCQSHLSHV